MCNLQERWMDSYDWEDLTIACIAVGVIVAMIFGWI